MRLYLSSFRLGDHAGRLLQLTGRAARVAVVANALDAESAKTRQAAARRELIDLAALGLSAEELDLRQPDAAEKLSGYDAVWVRGGNTFVLRKALATSNADTVLTELIRSEAIVYAGYSAGPVVLAPSLRGFEVVDDATVVTPPIWQGLGILDRPVVPHVDSPSHPATARCAAISAQLTVAGTQHWALRDGDVLLDDGQGISRLPASSR